MQFLTTLLPLLLAPLATAQIPCFQTYGWIQEITFLSTEETHYLPQIYLKKIQTATTPNVTICDGQYPFHANPDQPDFIPGGIPTNTSFAGPWGAFNCSDPYWQVDVNGIDGNILVRYNEDATYVEAGAANWLQVATAQGVAGFPDQRISVWQWDSRDVGCGA